jgi:hypothetical protein
MAHFLWVEICDKGTQAHLLPEATIATPLLVKNNHDIFSETGHNNTTPSFKI